VGPPITDYSQVDVLGSWYKFVNFGGNQDFQARAKEVELRKTLQSREKAEKEAKEAKAKAKVHPTPPLCGLAWDRPAWGALGSGYFLGREAAEKAEKDAKEAKAKAKVRS
jgi:hypothetical protein